MKPFTINVSETLITDLRQRLAKTRWPQSVLAAGWRYGTEPKFLRGLCDHWQDVFDWRAQEARLNSLPQFRTDIDGVGIHLVHAHSQRRGATPLLLTNGWPSSIVEYRDIIPRLTAAGFDVIAPALPGYGFSDQPKAPGMNATRIADLFAGLLSELGYQRVLAHASDMGAGVVEQMRRRYPERLIGIHFSNVYWGYPPPADPTPEEREYFRKVQQWQLTEAAYAMLQGTKPQTLAYGLNDSPAGLAGWIMEKFHAWVDGDPLQVLGLDDLCVNLTIYWATQTIGSSIRLYAEAFADTAAQAKPQKGEVPVGVAVFPKDILPAPRPWGERWLNLVHWTDMPKGGHFPAWEVPNLLLEDLISFRDLVI